MDPFILDESTNPFYPYERTVKKSAGRGEMLGNLVGLRYSDKFHSQTVNTQHQLAVQKIPPKCHILEWLAKTNMCFERSFQACLEIVLQ